MILFFSSGISGDQVEVEPVGHSTKHFFPRSNKSQKPVRVYDNPKIRFYNLRIGAALPSL